ncbi:hypothetical protein F4808DRAFT_409949 [Astrocystis sublimbata]|nr:hypothetical protein F4808DRAFT_409949 [Astrocystis sublimbata]
MSKSTNQSLSPNDTGSKRSSFSLTRSIGSVRKAFGGERRTSDNLASTNPFADPPPAYSETTAAGSGQTKDASSLNPPGRVLSLYSRLRGAQGSHSESDKFRFLAEFDTLFLIDDSYSMSWSDRGDAAPRRGELSRWEQTRNVIEQIVPICMRYDQDGVDIYFLNDPFHMDFDNRHKSEPSWNKEGDPAEGKAGHGYIGVQDANVVKKVFNSRTPALSTPTGSRLGNIMETYVSYYEACGTRGLQPPKPLNIIVITDGAASDRTLLRDKLIKQAERLDALSAPYHQLGVQFFQVGRDEEAARFLRELDDGLGSYRRGTELRDIVDCVTHEQFTREGGSANLTADVILKIVLGAVNRHLDNQKMREGVLQ